MTGIFPKEVDLCQAFIETLPKGWRNNKNEYIGSYETEGEAERAAIKARNQSARKKPAIPANPFAISAM